MSFYHEPFQIYDVIYHLSDSYRFLEYFIGNVTKNIIWNLEQIYGLVTNII